MKGLFSGEKWKYAFYTVSHPMDAYYEIRHRERGSVPVAVVLVMLFSFSFSINRIAASFVVNDVYPLSVNALTELIAVLLLYLLFCVGNWSITCLMEGEGRLKDIAIAVGYAMIPIIVCYNLATLVSQFVAADEEAFYWVILVVGIAYGLLMMLMGIMQVHNYTLGKTLVT
ncbi:MAG: YIP1 family protein, partial [Lachnospiraceae bacterium]|nr:YIP1 family protein [Lachnospiraceae bacterium]